MEPFDHIISLGARCQTAHQIRRYFGVQTPWPFDWWVTPTMSLIELLENDFDGLFDPNCLEIGDGKAPGDGKHWTLCRRTGVIHAHDFERDQVTWEIDMTKFPAMCAANRVRYGAVIDWFRRLEGRVLFVRCGKGFNHRSVRDAYYSVETLNRLMAALDKRLPGVDARLLLLSGDMEEPADPDFDRTGIDAKITFDHADNSAATRWEGDDAAWDAVFERHGGRGLLRDHADAIAAHVPPPSET